MMKKQFSTLTISLAFVSLFSAPFILSGFSKPVDNSLKQEVVELANIHPSEGNSNSAKQVSLASVEIYRSKALKLHERMNKIASKRLLTTVTFSNPLSVSDTADFIGKQNIQAKLIYAYGKENSGEGFVTTGVFIEDGDSKEMVNELINRAKDEIEGSDATFIGFLSVIGKISKDKIIQVQDNPQVYLTDISADSGFGVYLSGEGYVQHLGYDLYELKHQQ